MTRHHRRAVALIIVAIVVGGAGIAVASIPDAAGVIHGCVSDRNGAMLVRRPAADLNTGRELQLSLPSVSDSHGGPFDGSRS